MNNSGKPTGQIIITGATGFIGKALCEAFAKEGYTIFAGCREPVKAVFSSPQIIPFTWNVPHKRDWPKINPDLPVVCIHAAYAMTGKDLRQAAKINVLGTKTARKLAKKSGCDYQVFLSSCSAHEKAESLYGKSKFALEKEFSQENDLILRPGLVMGDGGLVKRMRETLQSAPIVPLFDGGKQTVQLIALEELVEIIIKCVNQRITGRHVVAQPDHCTMKELMQRLAKPKHPIMIPIPSAVALPLLQFIENLGINLPVTSENLKGLRGMVLQERAT